MQAPVHGLQAFVDEAAFKKLIKGGECRCLIGGIHGQVRLFPLPKDAQPLKLAPLQVHKLLCVGAAGRQELLRRHFKLFAPQLLIYLDLDRQPVAVPARDVGRVIAGHRL